MLIVKSGINQLHCAEFKVRHAADVCWALAVHGASFYCEPQPGERARIYVDLEYAPLVKSLSGVQPERCGGQGDAP